MMVLTGNPNICGVLGKMFASKPPQCCCSLKDVVAELDVLLLLDAYDADKNLVLTVTQFHGICVHILQI